MRSITNGRGEETEAINYLPYGQDESNRKRHRGDARYTGQMFDEGTGLYYYNARYYDPMLGRFLSPDTLASSLGEPQSLNGYSYVLNNPLTFNDPTGHAENSGWGHMRHGGASLAINIVVFVAAAALAPETGGASIMMASAALAGSAFFVEASVGVIEVSTGISGGTAVDEAVSTASGVGPMMGEVVGAFVGGNYEQREAFRSLGESIEAGFDFKNTAALVARSAGAAKALTGEKRAEALLGLVSAGKYLANKAIGDQPHGAASEGKIERPSEPAKSNGTAAKRDIVYVEWENEQIDVRPEKEKADVEKENEERNESHEKNTIERPDQPEVPIRPPD